MRGRSGANASSALGLLQMKNPNSPTAADPLQGLVGEARRWGPNGGGLGGAQLDWLRGQLESAAAAGERGVVMSRLGCLPGCCAAETAM